jgi:hypothetical protein
MDDSESMHPWVCHRSSAELIEPGRRNLIRHEKVAQPFGNPQANGLLELRYTLD